MTREQIIALVPKSKKMAIKDAWEDSDGVWVILKEGWNADYMDSMCRTIHEGGEDFTRAETIKHLKYQFSGIRKI